MLRTGVLSEYFGGSWSCKPLIRIFWTLNAQFAAFKWPQHRRRNGIINNGRTSGMTRIYYVAFWNIVQQYDIVKLPRSFLYAKYLFFFYLARIRLQGRKIFLLGNFSFAFSVHCSDLIFNYFLVLKGKFYIS